MRRMPHFALAPALLLIALAPRPTTAAWPNDPYLGNAYVCTASGDQYSPDVISDGDGGAIIVWSDYRSGSGNIYAQRLGLSGEELWTHNGVVLCAATGDQTSPVIVPDGLGGAIVVWEDARSGPNWDLYAQRINSAGVVQWTTNGVALCTSAGDQRTPRIAADGSEGVVVAWQDARSGTNWDIYAQRFSKTGANQWTANGVSVCTAVGAQSNPSIVADGGGGAILAWEDARSSDMDIYAQRLNSGGAYQWGANGLLLSNAGSEQDTPVLAPAGPVGTGGAIVVWQDRRVAGEIDLYAQQVSQSGSKLWTNGGVAVCTAVNGQISPAIVADGAGGAIVVWQDARNFTTGGDDIYVQRIGGGGVPLWSSSGVAVCTAPGDQSDPRLIDDGAGGAIMTWRDNRWSATGDIYAQRVNSTGSTQWGSNGAALGVNPYLQGGPRLAPDGSGGAIAAWYDNRWGNHDIFAQRIERYGKLGNPEPVIDAVKDVPNDQGGFVKVSWDASYLDVEPTYSISEYRVFRSVPWIAAPGAAAKRAVTDDSDVAARDGALLAQAVAGNTIYWEYVGTQLAETLPGYSRVVATTADSVAGANPRTWFMVEARTSTSSSAQRWFSAPDSSYSVDNLAPAMPAPLTGQYAAGTTVLHWDRNREPDLAGYRLYRGSFAAFTPGPENLVAALPDTGYADAAGAPYVYKLTAVDAHGNESPVATLVPERTSSVDGPALSALAFAAPGPNPTRGEVMLRWTLTRSGPVRLAVFDAAGRRVQVLREGELPAGEHTAGFVLRDDAGRALPSGLYLVRLEAEGRVLTRRVAAVR